VAKIIELQIERAKRLADPSTSPIKRPCGEMVDTTDLKSVPLGECRFESGQGHHSIEDARDARELWKSTVRFEPGADWLGFLADWTG
jgi:hypothetical protein